jgi:DNA anti-recombination protein RmuC
MYEEKLNTDHLRSAITALNEKLKFYENIEQERLNLKEQLDESDEAREELRNNIRENAERIKEEKDKNIKY